MNATPRPGLSVPALTDACAEQLWNERQLQQPVQVPAWRVWTYRQPAVVLGCSQRRLLATARDDVDTELLVRTSGGGAVLVGPWMVGLSVALPTDHALAQGGLVASYRWLGELLAMLLQDAGIAARALPPDEVRSMTPPASLDWSCFGGLSPWEVVVGGRKIAGLAQVRRRTGVLWVGGLLLDTPDWSQLCRPLGRHGDLAAVLAGVTTSWADETGQRPPTPRIVATLEAHLRATLAVTEPPPLHPPMTAKSTPSRVCAAC